MSTSANLDLVRSIMAASERGDFFGSPEWAHPDIEFVHADGPAPARWTGMSEMAQAWRDFLSAWKDFRIVAEEYLELDERRILVLGRRIGRAKASGVDLGKMGARGATLFHLDGGKVTRVVFYFDRRLALADLGLAAENGVQR